MQKRLVPVDEPMPAFCQVHFLTCGMSETSSFAGDFPNSQCLIRDFIGHRKREVRPSANFATGCCKIGSNGPSGGTPRNVWTMSITRGTFSIGARITLRIETALKETKVQLRMRPLQKDVITRAAELKQTTITNFMVEQAFSAAQQILADQTHFYLSPDKWDEFCVALDGPPKDLPVLRRLLTEPSVFDESK